MLLFSPWQVSGFVPRPRRFVLSRHEVCDTAFDRLLVQHLATGDQIDLGTKSGNTVFIRMLHARMTGKRRTHEIIAQKQIGTG